nr:MAG TPA: restriction alleviation protein [Bacteriophage sp.]
MVYKTQEIKIVEKEIEILPCPFCGSEKVKPRHFYGQYAYTPSDDYVECYCCGATGGHVMDRDDGNHLEEAINKWNNRA